MSAIIRPATPADLPAIERIVHDAYVGYLPRMGREPGPMRADYAAVLATRRVDVAVDGDLVGVVVLEHESDGMLLENVAVAPAAQGRGLGRMLIAHAEQVARAAGCTRIRLYTHVTMVENIALYGRLGFGETGRADDEGFDRVFFSKTLG